MNVRFRAIITRIQTMKTSSVVAVGVLIGLLLIFYIKESDFNNRVVSKTRRIDKSKKLTSDKLDRAPDRESRKGKAGKALPLSMLQQKNKNTELLPERTTESTLFPSSSTTMDVRNPENKMGNILKEKKNKEQEKIHILEHDKDMTGNLGDENDDEKLSADSTFMDDTTPGLLDNTENDNAVAYVQTAGTLPDTGSDEEDQVTQTDGQQKSGESSESEIRLNSPQETQRQTSNNPTSMKEQIEMLNRRYSDTLKEKNLPRQSDSYTQRLRNKLVQTGRLDLLQNENCKKRLPKCLIIGVMKAGTEAFSTFLGVHPQVAMQFGYAAMAFFSSPDFEKGYEWYRERMMCSTKRQVTMEKSPQYFSSPVAPKRIYDMDSEMKLILLVRDPVSRALSHFLQQQSSHPERLKAPTFEECVYNKETNQVIESSPYVQQSTYSVILKRWLKYFPFKKILIVDGDTFRRNPARSLSKAENFLGIDHSLSKDRLYFNKDKGFYCLKINSTIPEDIEMSCFGSEKGRPHPKIDPAVEDALKKYFEPFNKEFMDMTHLKMNW